AAETRAKMLVRYWFGKLAAGVHMADKQVLRNFVNGAQVEPVGGGYADLIDPVTGEVFAAAPVSGAEDVDRAMTAAAHAFPSWRDATPSERQRGLLPIAEAIE